jgi:RNA polymerase sigma factor (sigma-70 family)
MSSKIRDLANVSFDVPRLSQRTRSPIVSNELQTLNGMTTALLLRRVVEKQKDRQLSREALVAVLRFFEKNGDRQSADAVFIELIERVASAVTNKLLNWNSIAGSEMEDTRQAVMLGLHEYMYSLDSGEELWECNFKTCFDTRLLNIFGRLTRGRVSTVTLNDDNGGTADESIQYPDPAAESEFTEVEVDDALMHLNRIDLRLGKVFYLKYFADLTEKEIASAMDVNERTVRNWISSAKKALREYYAEL